MELTDAPILEMDSKEISELVRSLELEIKSLKEDKCLKCLYIFGSPTCKCCKYNHKLKDHFTGI